MVAGWNGKGCLPAPNASNSQGSILSPQFDLRTAVFDMPSLVFGAQLIL